MFKLVRQHLSLADLLLIIVLLCATYLSARLYWNEEANKSVYIYKDNLLFGEYPLTTDRVIVVDPHNTIQIKNHRVRMLKADCPDKRCVKQGYSSMLPIICLPNDLVVEIKSREGEHVHIVR
jgi:hypothetical protein